MKRRFLLPMIAVVSCALIPGAATLAGQTKAAAHGAAVQRTSEGHPDLQGIWSYATITPLERPAELAGKAVLTAEEAAELERRNAEVQNRDRRDHAKTTERGTDGRSDVDRAYNQFWWDYGTSTAGKQTSLIVDPADGRIPPLAPAARNRVQPDGGFAARTASVDNPEQRNLWERCITRTLPTLPGPYNNNIQIVQTKDYVVILNEMIHEARIVPLDKRPLNPVRLWHGQSRGRWEGDTLIVETSRFSDKANFRGAGPELQLVERYRLVDGDTLQYQVTINDPGTWTRPWTVSLPMSRSSEQIYEYACHEGNHGLEGILKGSRAEDKRTRTDSPQQ
jgi:hypothetical protein